MKQRLLMTLILLAGCSSAPLDQPRTLKAPTCKFTTTKKVIGPDVACTPGAFNPDVTQATIATTICKTGWTATIRSSATSKKKKEILTAYGVTATGRVLDHRGPLELGFEPDVSLVTVWPQPTKQAAIKDGVERRLRNAVCSGVMTLAEAQAAMLRWPGK